MSEIFISADVEADGRIPGLSSMLSLGAVAFIVDNTGYRQLSVFEKNLVELRGAEPDPKVMEWWKGFPDAWARCRANAEHPEIVMPAFLNWIKNLSEPSSIIAYPAAFDFMFIHWYLFSFTGEMPFGQAALCIKSYAMGMLKSESWQNFEKRKILGKYLSSHPHDHTPLNDAIEQEQIFAALYYDNVLARSLF